MSGEPLDRLKAQASSNDPLQQYLKEGQEPKAVREAHAKVSQILTRGEEIVYIAVQKPIIGLSPDSAVLTNRRFILYRPRFPSGASFEDYIWRNLEDAHLDEGMIRSTFTLKTIDGETLALTDLPKDQARRLYAYAQEMEERVLEERRYRDMEEQRAAAGGIVMRGASPAGDLSDLAGLDDPVQRLQQLKEMADRGLITSAEYEAKKNEILSRM